MIVPLVLAIALGGCENRRAVIARCNVDATKQSITDPEQLRLYIRACMRAAGYELNYKDTCDPDLNCR